MAGGELLHATIRSRASLLCLRKSGDTLLLFIHQAANTTIMGQVLILEFCSFRGDETLKDET